MRGFLAQGLSCEMGGFPMLVVLWNKRAPAGVGCWKWDTPKEGGGNPYELGWRWGLNSRTFSCNYVFIYYLGSETTGHLVTNTSLS